MKKIDLHMHTKPSVRDADFQFSLPKLSEYVASANLDTIAITNHDLFDRLQFEAIRDELDITVFPGIELNLTTGHLLLIADGSDLIDFDAKCKSVSEKIRTVDDSLNVAEVRNIFGDLKTYLLIPHFDKKPAVTGNELDELKPYVSAGEVDSARKFVRNVKDIAKLTPVLFSDARIREELLSTPVRQTYVDCGAISLQSLKMALSDKAKVALSSTDGNSLFQVVADRPLISTGLNILLGDRSSGKTHFLDEIERNMESVKYIRQFDLVQRDEKKYEQEFNSEIAKKRSIASDDYLSGFKKVLDDVLGIELKSNDDQLDRYIESLLKAAEEADRVDSFAQAALFNETEFSASENKGLSDVIQSTRNLIENLEYREIIVKHINIDSLKGLACELIELYWEAERIKARRVIANGIIREIREQLQRKTSATQVTQVDFYKLVLDEKKVNRFEEIVYALRRQEIIATEEFYDFRVVTKKGPFSGAGEIKKVSRTNIGFTEPFVYYDKPYIYLQKLKERDGLTPSEFYRFFANVEYLTLNKDGAEVSGGERSEFRLLQEILDAQRYDLLLIDEPESSFDNVFLKEGVNNLIKDVASKMPVVVVTHNSTIGASIAPDYFLYTKKIMENGKLVHKIYSGYPGDRELLTATGELIRNFDVITASLEAGYDAYRARGEIYENLKN
ncbi:MAG TPA: phosphotransferase [Gammaproteobacteria bacterium]